MGDFKLFRIGDVHVKEIENRSVVIEKSLQTLIEHNLLEMFAIRLIKSEAALGDGENDHIDTLGVDENNLPVMISYKRSTNDNAINRGIYLLDWFSGNRDECETLITDRLGKQVADSIEWAQPRLICIAGDYNKYDLHLVERMNHNIDLIRLRQFDIGFLMIELIKYSNMAMPISLEKQNIIGRSDTAGTSVASCLQKAEAPLIDLFQSLSYYLLALGDDVQRITLQDYVAFKRIKNFASVVVDPEDLNLKVYIKLDIGRNGLLKNISKAVKDTDHAGTGNVEITLATMEELETAKPLIVSSFETN
ncbi:MAG: DUF91 domain-containing protein [Desulfobacteraceae bacterium]|nr:DUF91 domain-containing protein [Desulfobacteraceae bacterium]